MRRPKKPPAWTPRPKILLDPPVPVPLSGTAPRVVLGQKWWDKERRAAFVSTGFRCIVCEEFHLGLEGHERYEIDWLLGRATYLETVPLCSFCHAFIHPGFLQSRVQRFEITRQEMEDILERGREILRKAGLERPDDAVHKSYSSVAWSDWRLVVAGKEYEPIYASLAEFRETCDAKD